MKLAPLPSPMMSLWKSLKLAGKDTPADETLSVEEFVSRVRAPEPEIAQAVGALRAAIAKGNKNRAKMIKESLPAVTISGTFFGRANDRLEEHNGLLQVDFDKLPPGQVDAAFAALSGDPHTLVAARSPSLTGVKGAIRVPVAEDGTGHAEAFAAAERYFREVHNLTLDTACKDVARLCFVTHDPEAVYNPNAAVLDVEKWGPLPPEQIEAERLTDTLQSCRISTIKNPPPPPPVVLASAKGHTIATPGNLVTLEGIQKAGKSAVVGAVIASAIAREGAEGDFLGLSASLPLGSYVLHFDCEQSTDAHHRLVTAAVAKRAGLDEIPQELLTFSLLRSMRADRWQLVRHCCQMVVSANRRVGLIILDGAADFLPGVNDEEKALAYVEGLHRLADELQAVIVLVIHENPNGEGGKTRGHLGSELWRKSQACLGVKKSTDGISTLWGKFLRDGDWPEKDGAFFRYDITEGMHVTCDDPTGERHAAKDQHKRAKLEKLAVEVLAVPKSYTDLYHAIMEAEGVELRTAKERIKDMRATGIIHQMEGGSYARCN